MRKALLAIAALSVLVLTGCAGGSSGPVGSPPLQGDPDLRGNWGLVAATVAGEHLDLGATPPHVMFWDDRTDILACQDSYEPALDAGFVMTTASITSIRPQNMIACEPTSAATAAAIESLADVAAGTRDGDTLTLTGTGTSLEFEFEFELVPPGDPALLVGHWELGTIWSGDAGSVMEGTIVEIEFTDDGEVSGTTGCANFNGTYEAVSGINEITDLAYSGRPCLPLPGYLSMDADVRAALDNGFFLGVDGEGDDRTLRLSPYDSHLTLVFTPKI